MKSRSLFVRGLALALLACASLGLTACQNIIYKYESYNVGGRVTPPSGLQQRVMVAYTQGGASGGLQILDGLRNIRSNVQNTIPSYSISGFSAADPIAIFNYPSEQYGYVLNYADGSMSNINYATEATAGTSATFGAAAPSVGTSETGSVFVGAPATGGVLCVSPAGTTGCAYALNLPNVYKVAVNSAGSIMLAMTRNVSSTAGCVSTGCTPALFRVVQLPISNTPVTPPGAIDCQPLLIPLYCVVPVAGAYDRPVSASFSVDGNSVYILNAGPEAGGTQSSVSVLSSSALLYNNVPTVNPLAAGAPSPLQSLPVANPIPIPGGATTALSSGTVLYIAGQSTRDYTTGGTLTNAASTGLFTGYMTALNLTTYVPSAPVSISDGTHTKMLFADNNTLWIGSQACASGKRQAVGLNYNCLTSVNLSASTLAGTIVPAVTPGGATTVPYPNENGNLYYYGDLTGLCWVQNYNKVYTAYGGQVHAFNTADNSEINNFYITVQGTALDVAYMDALTNNAN